MDRAKHALIAEDDFATRWRMKRLMEPHICCDIAVSSSEVLQAFKISNEDGMPYNIMILNVALPGAPILETITEIRRREAHRNLQGAERIAFVVVTDVDSKEPSLGEILSQCEGHIQRPIQKGDFLGQLHSLGFLQT